MNLASIAQRLQDQVPALLLVGGAAKLEEAAHALTAMPAAFVIPGKEDASASAWGNQLVEQQVAIEVAIVLAVRNLADATGGAAVDALKPIRDQVRDALLNWTPDGAVDGLQYRGGTLLQVANAEIWWADTYSTTYMIRSV